MITTNVKGQIAQSKAELRAIELGFIPSKPIFDARYDLILDNGGELKRVQIKYAGSYRNGVVVAKLEYNHRNGDRKFYKEDEVDGLIVYIPRLDKLCFFEPEFFIGKSALWIRIEEPKIKNKNIIFAKNHIW